MRKFIVLPGLMLALYTMPIKAASRFTDVIPLKNASPYYPIEAQEHGESASLILAADIDQNGVPHNCHIYKTDNIHFNETSIDFCNRSRFRPANKDGINIERKNYLFPLNFFANP